MSRLAKGLMSPSISLFGLLLDVGDATFLETPTVSPTLAFVRHPLLFRPSVTGIMPAAIFRTLKPANRPSWLAERIAPGIIVVVAFAPLFATSVRIRIEEVRPFQFGGVPG